MCIAARAQQATGQSYWTFNFAPYLWLPSVNTTLNYNLPPALGGRLPTDITSGPGDYLPNLKFATMFAADARYHRFSILTDFMCTEVTASKSTVRSLDFFGLPSQPISPSLQIGATTTLKAAIWTLAGGYTIAQGDWGNFDVIAGFRFLNLNASTNYDLALTVTGPRSNGATFGGVGNISGSGDLWTESAAFVAVLARRHRPLRAILF